jgi:hypothetical protein
MFSLAPLLETATMINGSRSMASQASPPDMSKSGLSFLSATGPEPRGPPSSTRTTER